jgi:hypothetical protein
MHYQVGSHDVQVVFGDLNFRIHSPNEEVRRLVSMEDFEELKATDEWDKVQA